MKKTLLYISAIILFSSILTVRIAYASYEDDLKKIEDNYQEKIAQILNNHIDALDNLKEDQQDETQELNNNQNSEIESAYNNYEEKYPGATMGTFKTTDEYKTMAERHFTATIELSKSQITKVNELIAKKGEDLNSAKEEKEKQISSLNFEKEKKEQLESMNKTLEELEKKLAELEKNLKDTKETPKQNEIIKEIDETKEQIRELKENISNLKNLGSYEDMLKKSESNINDLLNQFKEKVDEILHDKEFSPSKIPKPSTLPGPTLTTPNQERKIVTTKILPRIASFVIGFAGVLALISILFSGVRMMLSGGEEEVFTSSKARIQWAILGLLISILAFIAVQITINIDFVENKSPTQNEENN